jgi:hypothetical protein
MICRHDIVQKSVELLAGNNRLTFELIATKQFSAGSKFDFFNVSSFDGDYKEVNQNSKFLSQSYLTAEVWRDISLVAGLSAIGSSITLLTVRPTAGLQYLLEGRDFFVLVLPLLKLTILRRLRFYNISPCYQKYGGSTPGLRGFTIPSWVFMR